MRVTSALVLCLSFASGLHGLAFDQKSSDSLRIDCHPEDGASKEACESRHCIWSPVLADIARDLIKTPISTPWCYYPDNYVGYDVTADGRAANIKLTRKQASGLPNDIGNVVVQVSCKNHLLRIRAFDADHERYEPELPKQDLPVGPIDSDQCDFVVTNIGGRLTVARKDNQVILFDTDLTKLIFADQLIQLTTRIDSPFIYGLGEHFDTFLKKADKWRTYSMLNYDRLPSSGQRSYGGFPFYINLDSNLTKAHGVYLRNSNGIDAIIKPEPEPAITFRAIGGILDIVMFAGEEPHDVVAQYQQSTGLPSMPPRWALGFHLCRYGYKTMDKLRTVWQRTRDAGIPFDVQWSDIDYMERYNDFTFDHQAYKGLDEFVKNDVHGNGMKYVILFDPGVSQEDNYEPYSLGVAKDIFVKTQNGTILVGTVWNSSNRTVFPDFSNPASHDYWAQLFVSFHQELEFDGAWIDMNDISNFVDGSIEGCPVNNKYESPPYTPGNEQLRHHTLCMTAKHRAGIEYDVHNLYSFYEAIATYKALELTHPNKRPFIISRSTYAGQGQYSGHWDGDVTSTWEYLRWTVPSIIEHSMYGFQMMGADICGFTGDTNVELCARWHTLGAFYTFSRNHNDDVSIDQDPVAMGPVVVEAARNSLLKRYTLLPYIYSLMFRGHLYAEPSVRSVAFEFFRDPEALQVEDQFLLGHALLVSPIVTPNTYSKKTYLPAGVWYEGNLDLKRVPTRIELPHGQWHETNNVSLTDIPLFYRGGYILPVWEKPEVTVAKMVGQKYVPHVYLDENSKAHGEVFEDDGETIDAPYKRVTFESIDNTLTIKMTYNDNDINSSIDIGGVKVFGLPRFVKNVRVNQQSVDYSHADGVLRIDLSDQVSKSNQIVVKWSMD